MQITTKLLSRKKFNKIEKFSMNLRKIRKFFKLEFFIRKSCAKVLMKASEMFDVICDDAVERYVSAYIILWTLLASIGLSRKWQKDNRFN